jgi:hypothetical protein
LLCAWPLTAGAQVQVLPDKEPQQVFAGEGRTISVLLHNPAPQAVSAKLRLKLFQASSATAIPLSEAAWRKMEVLPSQTVLDSATLDFPAVKAETRFVVQWLEDTNRIAGTTDVLVYPTNLLKELKPLAAEEPLGVFDPQNHLKPLLKAARVEFQDLEDTGVEDYRGKLVIAGPFATKPPSADTLAARFQALARKGVAVVWMQPPPQKRGGLKPSFYTVPEGKGAVMVVQADMVAGLRQSPKAQLNLIQLARLALAPEPPRLPYLLP